MFKDTSNNPNANFSLILEKPWKDRALSGTRGLGSMNCFNPLPCLTLSDAIGQIDSPRESSLPQAYLTNITFFPQS